MEIEQKKISSTYTHPQGSTIDQLFCWIYRHWIVVFALVMGIYVVLPFLAPIFMQLGLSEVARAIYFTYGFLCHQLPQRSFFLFGPKIMYSLNEVQAAWQNTTDPLILRQFIGSPQMGWKVAWSDRMVYMYTSTLIFGLAWAAIHRLNQDRRLRLPLQLPWWGLILFLLPMAFDGATHFVSDLAGIDQGFRYTNTWLATLTNNAFSPSFYIGNGIGSFNSWMRLLSGLSFGFGIIWFGFPYFARWFTEAATVKSNLYQKG